jgi:succinyl-CoA synthetase beta subunit
VQAVLQKVVVAVHLKLASGVKQDLQKPLIPDLGLLTLRVSLHQVLLNLLKLVFEEKMELVELNVLTSAVVAAQVQNLHPDLLEGLLLGLLLNPLKLARKAKVVVAAR